MKKAVFTFGRLNPPTVGHEKLVDKVKQVAARSKATPFVYLSQTQNKKKDPLTYPQKIYFAKRAFGNVVQQSNAKTIIQILQELESKGITDIILVVGSDRVADFKNLLMKYNGKDYTFDSIDVVSAGARDPDAEGVEGMSASKMRALATDDDFETFRKGAPSKLSPADVKKLYTELRKGMMLESYEDIDLDALIEEIDVEEEDLDEVLDLSQRLKKARQMKRMAPRFKNLRKIKAKRMADPKRLMMRARKQALNIVRKRVAGKKGQNYTSLTPAEKIAVDKLIQGKTPAIQKLAQRLMPKVKKAEMERLKRARSANEEVVFEARGVAQDKDIADRPGTQPAKYYKDLAPSTKKARDAQFKKQTKMADDDPSAYKLAPGDKSAETKPSKHTKKYKQMFGEGNGQEDDVQDIVPGMMRVSMISSSKKKKKALLLDDKFEKFNESVYADAARQQHKAEKDRLKQQHTREKQRQKAEHERELDRAKVRDVRTESLDEAFEALDELSSIAPRDNYKLEEKSLDGLKKKAEKSGVPYSILKQVYDRGMAAWKTGHRPGTTPQQWAYARVNSFLSGGKTRTTADKDLWAKASAAKKSKKEDVRVGPYMDKAGMTESLDESFQLYVDRPAGYGQIVTAKEAGINLQGGFAFHPSVQEEGGAGEEGTDKLAKKYKKDTPGEDVNEKV